MLSLPLLAIAMPACANPDALGVDDTDLSDGPRIGEILVVAERIRGQLDLPQDPIVTLDEAEITALGASSIDDLLGRLAPQTGSGRGRGGGPPYVLVNGQRITNFRELRNYPPEAIRRVEVLPEEAALRLGYPADARVVNMILKDNYASRRIELEYGLPTRGGFAEWEGEATLLKITGPRRISLTATANDRSPLFEAERGVALPASSLPLAPGDPDPARFRSLIADSRDFGFNAALTSGLGKDGLDGTFSLNAAASRTDSRSWQGLDTVVLGAVVPDPLLQTFRTTTVQGGAGFARRLGSWQFSSTLDANYSASDSLTDRLDSAGQDATNTRSLRIEGLATLSGSAIRLPAGDVAATLKGGFTSIGFDSRDQRSPAGPVSLNRFRSLGGINLGMPLTSGRENFLGAIGDLTLNLGAELSQLSDFGAVNGWNAGLTWALTARLGLQGSYLVNEAAPAISQLGAPLTVTANVPVYDFISGQTVLVSVTNGGNPLLRKERQRDWKFGATWQLPVLSGSTAVIEYIRNRSDNVTAGFPLLTPEIEAAYPGRVTRDGSGRLTAIDSRAVTFAEQSAARIRWGFTLSDTLGKAAPGGGGRSGLIGGGPGARPGGPPGGPGPRPGAGGGGRPPGAGGGGGGRMMAMMGGGGQGRWSLGVYHTVQLSSRVLAAPGGPLLDLLDGDALSTSGTPRHLLEFNGGLYHKGKGMFVQGNWNAPTTLAASGLPGSSDLRFGAVTRANINFFVELGDQGKLAEKNRFFKGLRLSLRIENVFDSRQKVTDANGLVPLSYQADYLDPRGRVIELELRKMF